MSTRSRDWLVVTGVAEPEALQGVLPDTADPVGASGGTFVCPAGRHRRRRQFTGVEAACAVCAFEQAVRDVTGVLRGLLPDQPAELVERVVAAVATSGAKTRQLHAWLVSGVDPLRRGGSDTPAAAQALLRQLCDAGVPVVLPVCVSCGQPRRRLSVITEAGRVCVGCRQRQTRQRCGWCGEARAVAAHDDGGNPVCGRCRSNDQARWRPCGLCGKVRQPIAVVDGVMLGRCCYVPLSRRCTVCGLAKAVRRQPGRGSVCRDCRSVPVLDCASCGLDAPAPQPSAAGSHAQGAAVVLCARCRAGEPAPCSGCGLPTVGRAQDGTVRCPDCYTRPQGVCGRCGHHRPIARLATGDDLDLCGACWRGPVTECAACGQRRPCRGERTGTMLCETCRLGNPQPCSICGRTKRIEAHWPDGPVCAACYRQARVVHGACSRCGQVTRLLRHTRGEPACPVCLGRPNYGTCVNCGTIENWLPRRGRCTRCAVAARLRELLAPGPASEGDTTGTAALESLRVVLGEASSQRAVLDWLTRRRSPGRDLLERLARGEVECSHEGLDAVDQTVALSRLRHLLVAAGVLPDRDPVLAATTRWMTKFLTGVTDQHDTFLLRCYLRWKLLPPLRAASEKAPLTDAAGYATRYRLRDSAQFLAFLRERGRHLEDCRQEDLDMWVTCHPSSPSSIGSFWTWATRRGDMPRLRIPRRPEARTCPPVASRDERWALARALLHDDGIETADRVAGCLVLIYGQRPVRIVRLTTDDVVLPGSADQCPMRIRLGPTPVEIPDPLAGHVRALLTQQRGPTTAAVTSNWLFPSRTAMGRPIRPGTLSTRLARLGLTPEIHRSGALLDLAAQIPPTVLADVLGIAAVTAERWADLAGRDRDIYLALAMGRPGPGVVPS